MIPVISEIVPPEIVLWFPEINIPAVDNKVELATRGGSEFTSPDIVFPIRKLLFVSIYVKVSDNLRGEGGRGEEGRSQKKKKGDTKAI